MNDVHATSIFGSRLGRPDGFGCSPVGHAVLIVSLEEGRRIRVRISASLKRDRSHSFRTLQLMCYILTTAPLPTPEQAAKQKPDPLARPWLTHQIRSHHVLSQESQQHR